MKITNGERTITVTEKHFNVTYKDRGYREVLEDGKAEQGNAEGYETKTEQVDKRASTDEESYEPTKTEQEILVEDDLHKKEEPTEEEKSLEAMKVKEMYPEAKLLGIKRYSEMKRDELVEAITNARINHVSNNQDAVGDFERGPDAGSSD